MRQPSGRWDATLTKRYLGAELRAGRNPREIAVSVGCSENTVRDYMARYGLLAAGTMPRTLVRDYGRLGSVAGVAEKHGVSFSTARRWLLASGVALNEAHRPRSADIDIALAARRYAAGQSLAEIAKDTSVGVNTLKRRLETFGVTMRRRGRPRATPPRP